VDNNNGNSGISSRLPENSSHSVPLECESSTDTPESRSMGTNSRVDFDNTKSTVTSVESILNSSMISLFMRFVN